MAIIKYPRKSCQVTLRFRHQPPWCRVSHQQGWTLEGIIPKAAYVSCFHYKMPIFGLYPLVNCPITMENHLFLMGILYEPTHSNLQIEQMNI